MFPKPADQPPFDLDRALTTLRAERPSEEATARARAALLGAPPAVPRRSIARPLTAMLIAAALAVVVFTPRTRAGSAWAQTVVATRETSLSHSVYRRADGKIEFEEWRAPNRRATVLYGKNGTVVCEMRTDGKRSLNYFNWADVARFKRERLAPNAEPYAIVSKGARLPDAGDPIGSVESIVENPSIEVVGHEEAKGGRPETYLLRQTFTYPSLKNVKPRSVELVAEIDPKSRRVRALSSPGQAGRKEIDYPDSISPSVFKPRVQVAEVADTFDLEAQAKAVQRTLREGIAKDGPVTLRALLMDGDGALWAFWTGALPDGRLSRPVRFGVPCGPAYGMKAYTSDWRKAPPMNGRPVDASGPRLGGMARVPEVKVGSTVDVDIPYSGGVAHFRKVPIRRIGMIVHLDAVLGVRRDYR